MSKISMNHYARFTKLGVGRNLFRFETRIYIEDVRKSRSWAEGVCIAAVVGKNPGSAREGQIDKWACVDLKTDKMLRIVGNRFRDAYCLAGKPIPDGAFVSVWNLFYLVDAKLERAKEAVAEFGPLPPVCKSEDDIPKIVWFVWGGFDAGLNPFNSTRGLTPSKRGSAR